ncbi:hypothetical protein [uncultured Cellulomonas sp.]|uniref:hypothetical protein n=1 Tax=uncultured Cellulomonas sp. TaxID=189682 RepID=UPI002613F5FF|nr:hypothetical protein [uncultured Cellulomonas sp.]
MVTMVVWTLVALAAAALVLVIASVAETPTGDGRTGVRGYLQDLRAGVRTLRGERGQHGRGARQARRAADEGAAESTLEDFFAATEVQAPAYVAVEDLTDTLARARERAARGVHGLSRR